MNTLSVSESYNYNSGFSGGVSINTGGAQEFERRDGLNFGLNYNEQTGFGTTTGMTTGFFNYGYGISGIGHSSGTYGSAYMGFTSGNQGDYLRSSFDMNYNFRDNSFGGGVSVLQDFRGFDPNSTFFDTFSTALNWNNRNGFSNQIQYTLSNRGYDAVTGFMQGMASNMWNMLTGLGSAVSGMWRDEDENGNKIGEIWQDESGNSWITDKNGESKYLTPDEVLEMRLRQVFGDDIRLSMVGDSKNEYHIFEKDNQFENFQELYEYYLGDAQASDDVSADIKDVKKFKPKVGDIIETQLGSFRIDHGFGEFDFYKDSNGNILFELKENSSMMITLPSGNHLRIHPNTHGNLNELIKQDRQMEKSWYMRIFKGIFHDKRPEKLPGKWRRVIPNDTSTPRD